MNFLVVPDSFKGSLTSEKICALSKTLILEKFPSAVVNAYPAADGGEGSVETITAITNGKTVGGKVNDGNFFVKNATYGINGETAYISIANSSGLPDTMIKNPEFTTSYGFGQQIKQAINLGKHKICLCLGGSSTNDGGAGAAVALGAKFKNANGEEFVPSGGNLKDIAFADFTELKNTIKGIEFFALCDVKNPLLGKNGCSYIYAPQKGAKTEKALEELDKNMEHYAKLVCGERFEDFEGGGAAGGLGFFVKEILGGELIPGAQYFLDLIDFDVNAIKADYIITGEGKFDATSNQGKICGSIGRRCEILGKKATVFCGVTDADKLPSGIRKIYEINDKSKTLQENMKASEENFVNTFKKFLCDVEFESR